MVASTPRSAAVSRTSSSSSTDFAANLFNSAEQRRTRKRISAAQLVHLEELYRQSSHPTRDQRDALAKRIHMETKSVTIWFQNKRQTDRKVALHNATNSRNVAALPATSTDAPDITLTAPTSPAYPPNASVPQGAAPRPLGEGHTRRHSLSHSNALKRVPSHASSVTSTSSTTSTAKSRPSLDRVASRSELRFSERSQISRSVSGPVTRPTSNNDNSFAVARTSGNSAPPLGSKSSCITRPHSAPSLNPPSPPPTAHPLWATMLSSPAAPSSPPPSELATYARNRKIRTLDWACAAARLAAANTSSKMGLFIAGPGTASSLGPSPLLSPGEANAAEREREYEEATAITEDEAELVTPNGSQDTPMSWGGDHSACDTTEISMHSMGLIHPINHPDKTNAMTVDEHGWQEDEMHAALALCGLKG